MSAALHPVLRRCETRHPVWPFCTGAAFGPPYAGCGELWSDLWNTASSRAGSGIRHGKGYSPRRAPISFRCPSSMTDPGQLRAVSALPETSRSGLCSRGIQAGRGGGLHISADGQVITPQPRLQLPQRLHPFGVSDRNGQRDHHRLRPAMAGCPPNDSRPRCPDAAPSLRTYGFCARKKRTISADASGPIGSV
jgi:hypothetical protein